MRKTVSLSSVSAMVAGILLAAPAQAASYPPSDFDARVKYFYGYSDVVYDCFRLPDLSRLPQIQALVNGAWTTVAYGQTTLVGDYLPATCPADYPTAIYFNWLVQTRGSASGVAGIENLEVRQVIPDATQTVNRTFTKKVASYKCLKRKYRYRKWVTKTYYPASGSPVTGGTYVYRCRGGDYWSRKWKVISVTVPETTTVPGSGWTGSSKVVKIYLY